MGNSEIIQADAAECLLLGKADSSKMVNLMNLSGCFRPKAATGAIEPMSLEWLRVLNSMRLD